MHLMCRLDHMAGQSILVEGTWYPIADNGLCMDVADEDAAVLLEQPGVWGVVKPEDFADNFASHTFKPEESDDVHLKMPPGSELQIPPPKAPAVSDGPKRGRPNKAETEARAAAAVEKAPVKRRRGRPRAAERPSA